MGKAGKEKGKKRVRLYAGIGLVAAATAAAVIVTGIHAKYIHEEESVPGQVTPKAFYFTTDLLGDSCMLDVHGNTGDGTEYAFPDQQEGTFYLYGGGEHEIKINVRNFSDDLRVTGEKITYTVDWQIKEAEKAAGSSTEEGKTSDGTTAGGKVDPVQELLERITLSKDSNGEKKDAENGSENELVGSSGSAQASDTLTLTIPAYSKNTYEYKDGTTVEVTLTSTKPYEKKIVLDFALYSEDTYVKYKVKDASGGIYAELVIMTNVVNDGSGEETAGSGAAGVTAEMTAAAEDGAEGDATGGAGTGESTATDGTGTNVQPTITWPSGLLIDNTNNLTYAYTGGTQDAATDTDESEDLGEEAPPEESYEEKSVTAFAQQAMTTNGESGGMQLQIQRALSTNESVSIYFFKTDLSSDFSHEDQIVPPVNGAYSIGLSRLSEMSGESSTEGADS